MRTADHPATDCRSGKNRRGNKGGSAAGDGYIDKRRSASAERGDIGRGNRVGGEIKQFAVAACDSDGFGATEKWRGEIQVVFDSVVLSAGGADGASGPLLWTAGRQKELGRSRSHRRYHRSTESISAVVDSAGQWCERGCARIDHLEQTGSNEEYEVSERRRRLGCSCFFALKHQTQQGDNVCPRN